MRQQQKHVTDTLFVMVMFLVYAVSMLAFVYLGAEVYQSVTERMEEHDEDRTAVAYLTEKIRQHDSTGAVQAGTIEGQQALVIREALDGTVYVTYIYTDEGYLKELLVPESREARCSDGAEILELSDLEVEDVGDGRLRISFRESSGKERKFTVLRRSEKQGNTV